MSQAEVVRKIVNRVVFLLTGGARHVGPLRTREAVAMAVKDALTCLSCGKARRVECLRCQGRRGGKQKSIRKTEAVRLNAAQPRPRKPRTEEEVAV
jgi:hypothetical protein